MTSRPQPVGLTLVEVLVVIAIIAVLIGLLIPAIQRVRGAAARAECADRLRQIGLALHQYHGTYQRFPPGLSHRDGADPYPWMSWQARILPYLEQQQLWETAVKAYAQDKWFQNNPPHTGYATVVPLYGCPADARTLSVGNARGMPVGLTSYLGNEGINLFRCDGVLFLDSQIRLSDITDGTSNTLFVGERPPSPDNVWGWWYAAWGQNKDGSGDTVLGVRERNYGPYGPAACPPGPYEFGPGDLVNMCDVFHFWSVHSGGANFLFADGSVRFLSYSAAPTMPALATRSGGEAVEPPE